MAGWIGRSVGKVSIELLLARGFVADNYLGRHTSLQRAVCLKLLNTTFKDDPSLQERFRRDARALVSLRHPNIEQVDDFDSIDGRPYIVAEYVPGISLAAHLKALSSAGRRMAWPTADHIILSVAEALQSAHDRGILHRDLRTESILLTSSSAPVQPGQELPQDTRILVTDFGLAQFGRTAQTATSAQVARLRAYMSPEQIAGSPTDFRADLYSLGVVAHELLLGRLPSDLGAPENTGSVGSLSARGGDDAQVPAKLREVLETALDRDPARRSKSVREFAAAVHAALALPAEPATASAGSDIAVGDPLPAPGRVRNPRALVSTAIVGSAVLALTALLGIRFFLLPAAAPTPQATEAPATTMTSPESLTATVEAAEAAEVYDPLGALRFQDGAGRVDQVTFNAATMPPLSAGSQYEVWLVNESGEERRSVGYLRLDADGKGTVSFVDPEGHNLLGLYSGLEITVEPDPDSNPNPAADIAFAVQLPAEGLLHVRHILVSFGRAPEGAALLQGLVRDASLASTASQEMLDLFEAGDQPGARRVAEGVLNMLLGSQSPEYSDWDADGQIEDIGDGYGMLLNGDQSGYIQGSFAHAEFAVSSPGATAQMESHGQHVMVSTRNLEDWTPQLRDLLRQIVSSPFDAETGGLIRQAVALSETILHGTDLNGNERVEAITGEGGAETAYQHALYMADVVVTLQE